MRPKADAVIEAMKVLLTARQIKAVSDLTAGGSSKLEAVRSLVNRGIAERESERRAFWARVRTAKAEDERQANQGGPC